MGYIYKITNLINNKIYIGQTRFEVEARYHRHLYEAKRNVLQYPLYKAIRKYGEQNFKLDIIEQVDNELLNQQEQYWIKYYDSYIKNNKGYNCTYGGEGSFTIDRIEVYDLWDKGLSINEISKLLNHNNSAIREILKGYQNYNIEESNKRGDKIQAINRFKSVNQYDIKGNLINTYYNMYEAERQTGISSKRIYLGVHLKQKLVDDFQWRFIDDKEHPVEDLSNQKRRMSYKVKQINKNNNEIINTYKNASEASRQTGINDTLIRKVCQQKGKTAGGYKWEYF